MPVALHDLETISKQQAGHMLVRNDNLFVIVHNLFQMLCTNPEEMLCTNPEAYVGWRPFLDFLENREFAMEEFMGIFNCASGFLLLMTYYLAMILYIFLDTTSGVKTNYPNLSPSGPLNCVSGTGNEMLFSLVKTELKSIFNSSATKHPCVNIPSIVRQWSNLIPNILLTSFMRK